MSDWDMRTPETIGEIIQLLGRRIEVHKAWRDYSVEGSQHAKDCESHGVGTAESHQTYINQYEGAISVMKSIDK